jgi:hypothetical protein
MNAKYADVVKTEEALAFLSSLASGMFELPAGSPRPSNGASLVANL